MPRRGIANGGARSARSRARGGLRAVTERTACRDPGNFDALPTKSNCLKTLADPTRLERATFAFGGQFRGFVEVFSYQMEFA